MTHIEPYANELSRLGFACTVAVTERSDFNSEPQMQPLFSIVTYSEINETSKLLFPNSRAADIIHAWTPRENVRKLVYKYKAKNPVTKIIVHLEDNEEAIIESYYRRPIERLKFPLPSDTPVEFHPNLSHPTLFKQFLWDADAITTLNPRLTRQVPSSKHTLNINPILDLNKYAPLRSSDETRLHFGIPKDRKLIVYPGGITSNNREDIRNLYLAVSHLNQTGTYAIIAKTGPNCKDLERSFEFPLDSIRLDFGFLDRCDVNDLVHSADLLIQPAVDNDFNRDRFPCKIPEFLLSGRPTIFPRIYDELLESDQPIGLRTACDTPQNICQAIRSALVNYKELEKSARFAKAYALEKYSAKNNARSLSLFYNSIHNKNNKSEPLINLENLDFRLKFLKTHKSLKTIEKDIVKLNNDIKTFQQERAELKQEIRNLHRSKAIADNKIERIQRSFSWRITSPLRFLRRTLIDPLKARQLSRIDASAKAVGDASTQEDQKTPPPGHPCFHKGYYEFVQRELERRPERIELLTKEIAELPNQPKISILLPTYNVEEVWLRKCIDSVLAQTYTNWELCVADDASTNPKVRKTIFSYAIANPKIKAIFRARNGHISEASNSAAELATGEYIALLDHDDEIPPHALARFVLEISRNKEAKILYSDEDKIDENGVRHDPHFKSDWNYDFFLGCNMISHFGFYERNLFNSVGRFRKGYEGAQDWDLALRIIENCASKEIVHVPEVLYHWRSIKGSTAAGLEHKSYAYAAQKHTLISHLERIGVKGTVESVRNVNWRIVYDLPNPLPSVTIIIPTRNQAGHLINCIESLTSRTDYSNYRIIIADNESDDTVTLNYLLQVTKDPRIRVVHSPGIFNFSRINNQAILEAESELICLLNNDTEVIHNNWLSEMVRHGVREEVGVVGAKLLFPHDHIQHCGIILGIHDIAGHAFKFLHESDDGHVGRAKLVSQYSAVTGACMLFRRRTWEKLGGLNEKDLPISYNDVDFCLRASLVGLKTVLTPFALLYHKESISRGEDMADEEILRFESESDYMRSKWSEFISRDQFYNPNLTKSREDFSYI